MSFKPLCVNTTTGEITNNYLQNIIQVGDVSFTITKGSISTSVTANPPKGYTFLCWIQVITDGWVGSIYPNTPRDKTCTLYKYGGEDSYRNLSGRAYYLFVRTN